VGDRAPAYIARFAPDAQRSLDTTRIIAHVIRMGRWYRGPRAMVGAEQAARAQLGEHGVAIASTPAGREDGPAVPVADDQAMPAM